MSDPIPMVDPIPRHKILHGQIKISSCVELFLIQG